VQLYANAAARKLSGEPESLWLHSTDGRADEELTRNKLNVPMLAWGGRRSFGDHCFESANAIATKAQGGVVEECGHWVFEENPDFIVQQLSEFWSRNS
jgi:pimeloyl-ACP methyl ester carboxylesterase